MATGSPGATGTTGPRPCPTPSWKEEELSGLGEGTSEWEERREEGGGDGQRKCYSLTYSLFAPWFLSKCLLVVEDLHFHSDLHSEFFCFEYLFLC